MAVIKQLIHAFETQPIFYQTKCSQISSSNSTLNPKCQFVQRFANLQKCRFPKMYAEKSSEFNAPSSGDVLFTVGGFSLWERSISTISDVKGWRLHQSNSCPSSVANSLLSIMFIYTVLDKICKQYMYIYIYISL